LLGQQKAWCGFSTLHVSRTRRTASLDPEEPETEAYACLSIHLLETPQTNDTSSNPKTGPGPLLFLRSGALQVAASVEPNHACSSARWQGSS